MQERGLYDARDAGREREGCRRGLVWKEQKEVLLQVRAEQYKKLKGTSVFALYKGQRLYGRKQSDGERYKRETNMDERMQG